VVKASTRASDSAGACWERPLAGLRPAMWVLSADSNSHPAIQALALTAGRGAGAAPGARGAGNTQLTCRWVLMRVRLRISVGARLDLVQGLLAC
jgi:hypothetical protein